MSDNNEQENATPQSAAMPYVFRDEPCDKCGGEGIIWDDEMGDTSCPLCEGQGYVTRKVPLADALAELRGRGE